VTEAELAHVDATLLLIAEARDRAERAIRELSRSDVVPALVAAERDLLALHNQLHRAVYFPAADETQLKLAG